VSKKFSDPLDDLLRHWAGRQSFDGLSSQRLQARVTASLRGCPFLDLPSAAANCGAGTWSRLRWFAAGAAAAMLLAWLLSFAHRTPAPLVAREETGELLPPVVGLPKAQLIAKARLLAAAEELFNGRLAWMAEEGRDVQLGLTDAATLSQAAPPIVFRLVILARKSDTKNWRPIWQADLVTRDEQLVELTPGKSDKSQLRLWAYALPDGQIAVDSDLLFTGAIPIHSASSGVQQGGVPRQVFSLQNDDGEYRVFQTVDFLRKGVG
jgi:hypothetical protein